MFFRIVMVGVLSLWLGGCAGTGKAKPDLDRDSVADNQDQCPDTDVDIIVDANGCDLFNRVIESLSFEAGQSELNVAARQSLDRLVSELTQYPDVKLVIAGHTDNRGSARDNLALSKKRVMSVVRYLVIKGVDGRRLRPIGYGESRPLVSNSTEQGRIQNRRIEVTQWF